MQHAPFTALARVYDAIMADIEYDVWADFILSYAAEAGLSITSALDLACGTGGLTQQLAALKLEVTGLDASPEMLKVAAERMPGVRFVQGDLRTFELGRTFDLVTCVFDSVNNLTADGDLELALRQMHAHLSPGGLLAFDVNTRIGVRELWEGDSIEGLEPLPDGSQVHYHWSHHYNAEQDVGVVQAFCRVLSEDGETEEFVETHQERGYDPAELAAALGSAGFERWEILEYPDYAPPEDDSPRVWVFAWRASNE
ncbi:class I SAM-dependent methyltransferase [Deinococcus psychrotolerans]|uniref:Class I SAM-dependent methyltransferase n=1 Tax=Deinococcus psychrotolerans TaxID=2489213 RepID=A0A3G8YB84_9DEIO|nr:class I SAM-dependent methyltransferase [Deinococcus psychrotolerans]AZI42649.1 class I SAM-dependent methyltransferase [Deinococcus psychrotolerans]